LDDGGNVIGIKSFVEVGKQGLNFAISVGEVKRFLSSGGNRLAESAPESNRRKPQQAEGCEPHQFESFINQKTKKLVIPIDTICRGKPNLYLVGERADQSPEFALIDDVGDGKFDIKIIFAFDGRADLWIFTPNAMAFLPHSVTTMKGRASRIWLSPLALWLNRPLRTLIG
jgi:hypothetical protein